MSGLRAHNEELTSLGLTLPGFVERNKVIASLPSLGLLTLAGLTPRDIEVEYAEVEDIRQVNGLPVEYDAVAISSFSAQIKEAYELADRFRDAGTRVILGGLHVTARPDEARKHADAVVLGEGEPSWPRVVEDLKRQQLQEIYDSRDTLFDFAHAPMPRFELLDPERYNRLTVQTQRGCPYNCEFCAASIRLSPRYRVKPVEKVIKEIRRIKELWSRPFIEFADDNTFVNKRHGKQLLRALAKLNVRWFTETDVSVAQDDELLGLMRDSGCKQILIGFESPSQRALHGIERRSDWKARQYDSYMAAIDKIQSYGISVNGCFILGLDGTGPDSFEGVLDFVRQSGLHEVQITVLTAFPGTPLYQRLKRAGRLLNDQAWEFCTLFDVNYKPQNMTVAELEAQFCWLAGELYSESGTRRRKEHFLQNLRKSERWIRNERRTDIEYKVG